MPAQGTALGIGSGVENSNALKGQNRFVVKNLVSPFQGWVHFHSDRIPRADPASGVPPAWAFLFWPLRGGRKLALPEVQAARTWVLAAGKLRGGVGHLPLGRMASSAFVAPDRTYSGTPAVRSCS